MSIEEDIKELEKINIDFLSATRLKVDMPIMIQFSDRQNEALNNALTELKRLQKENEELKANRLFTRNKATDKEKAEIVDVLDNTIDLFYEKTIDDLKKQLDNSISKDTIKEYVDKRIKSVDKLLDEMIDKSTGAINLSYLSVKEQEELINKRNCLLVQKATLQQILEELLKEKR